jgi:CheY-like chemotaxis protein
MQKKQTCIRTVNNRSILVVDDESDVRLVLNAMLTRDGYSVTEAADGREALDLLEDREFDLIFLDLMMPRLTGEEVLEFLKADERLARIPVIVLTAKSQLKDVELGYEKGASFYVVKPFSNKTIRELSKYLLDDLDEEERETILFDLLAKQEESLDGSDNWSEVVQK